MKEPMQKITVTLSAVLAALLSSGCTSVGRLDKDLPPPTADEAIYILGLSPANHRAFIFPGEIKDGRFSQNSMRAASYYGSSVDGYIVAKAKAGDVLAITSILATESERSLFGKGFQACGEQKTLTFTAAGGKVIYLGDISFYENSTGLRFELSTNFSAAQHALEKRYPNLKVCLQNKAMPFTKPTGHANLTLLSSPFMFRGVDSQGDLDKSQHFAASGPLGAVRYEHS